MAKRKGLYANIHAKRKRIKAGSGERMRKPGSKGAPTAKTENLSEGVDNAEGLESHTASMTSYLKTLSAFKN